MRLPVIFSVSAARGFGNPRALFAGLALLALGCTKLDSSPIENLNGGRITVMGHAGSGFESAINPFPSNTLTSIRKTLEGYNADGTELDIQLTADSALVLYHDGTLESMTECEGYIYQLPAGSVTNCRYRTDFNSHILQDEHLLRLEDVLSRYQNSPLRPRFDFDLKVSEVPGLDLPRFRRQFARRLAEVTRQYDLLDRINFMTTDAELLAAVQRELPGARCTIDQNNFEQALATAQQYHLTGLVAGAPSYTAEQVRQAHAAGLHVTLYKVVRRAEVIEAVNKNPDAIQADNILLLQEVLTARYGH